MFWKNRNKSLLINAAEGLVEFGNRYFVLSKWLFRSNNIIFLEIELMMLVVILICVGLLLWIHQIPATAAVVIAVLLAQRIIEFLIVYSRNFIFNRGRIFSDFHTPQKQGEWLIMMFFLNVIQISLVFAVWYRLLSVLRPEAFSKALGVLDSLYFSMVTFLTIGYGDITPLSGWAKGLVMIQSGLTFYVLVIVINGLISIHFKK